MDFKYIGGDIPWSLPFGNHFNSSNSPKNTDELATIARRHGFEELSKQYSNVDNNSTWANAGVFFTNKTINSDLNGIHNTDFRDDHNHTFCYLCSINQHEHKRTKPRDESQRRKLIPYKNPKARSSSLDRIVQNPSSSSSDFISYRFIVRTGTQKNSGTRAQVYLYMYGTEKDWTSIHLQKHNKQNSSASIDSFPSGSVRTFCLKGPDIGQLHHLNVNLVGSHSDKEWFLEEIEITNLNTSITWLCEFNCWLPKTDEQEINQIKPNVHRQTEFLLSIYILQIRTGEKTFAGTDATIQLIVRGSKSQTHRLTLTSNRSNLFEQNQLDTFAIVGSDLGDLLEIIVESDKSQFATDWDIKEMIMWKIIPSDDHEKSQIYFPFNTWLGKKMNTLKSKREIYPSTDHHFKGPICYQVIVKTGKAINAGTDANVFLIIYGKCGRTVIHQLNNRLKNDFERNSISEFTIMDIDIGKIDRIKIWHDNSGPGSAWFLDSILIRKTYSTCQTISNIYIRRLEEISKALHRQIREQMKKNVTRHTSSISRDGRRSTDRHSLKPNDYDNNSSKERLGSSRGILRSPIMYDKTSLQKKVTWDEQSIGSQDDLLSINSQRTTAMQTRGEQKYKKEDSFHHETGHFDHQVYWISSHNYIDNKWKIKSIEEINSFDLDSSIRSLLLSDRSTINNKIRTSVSENDDEIYEFQANRWLAKDKEDGKLEVYLTAKLIHKSSITSDTSIDSKKKHPTSSNIHFDGQRQKYAEEEKNFKESKHSSPYDLGAIERSSKDLTPHDLRLSSSRLSNTSGTQLNDPHSLQRKIHPSTHPNITFKKQEESPKIHSSVDKLSSSSSLTQRPKSPHNINDLTDSLSSERELLAKLIGEPSYHSRSAATSLISPDQRSKSPRNINDLTDSLSSERELLARLTGEPSYHSRSAATSLISPDQRSKSPRNTNERQSLTKIPNEPPGYPGLTAASTSSSSQRLKSPRSINDLTTPITSGRESLTKISDQPLNHPRSSAASPLSSNQSIKSLRSINDRTAPSPNARDSLTKISREPPDYSQSPATLKSSSSQLSKSLRNTRDLIHPITSEQELLTRITGEPPPPSYRSPSSTTSLTSSRQRAKSPRNTNDLINSSMGERETLAKISSDPFNHPRSSATSSLSSNQFSKPIPSINEPTNSLTRASIEPPLRPKSAARFNPNLSTQKSIHDQVYSSAHGTAPSDDF